MIPSVKGSLSPTAGESAQSHGDDQDKSPQAINKQPQRRFAENEAPDTPLSKRMNICTIEPASPMEVSLSDEVLSCEEAFELIENTDVASRVLEFGVMLDLPPDFLLTLCPSKSDIYFPRMLKQMRDRLTIKTLSTALRKADNPHIACQLEAWAKENSIAIDTQFNDAQLQAVEDILRSLSDEWRHIGRFIEMNEVDENTITGNVEYLQHCLNCIEPGTLTAKDIITTLKTHYQFVNNRYAVNAIAELEAWGSEKKRDVSEPITSPKEKNEIARILVPLSEHWKAFAEGLAFPYEKIEKIKLDYQLWPTLQTEVYKVLQCAGHSLTKKRLLCVAGNLLGTNHIDFKALEKKLNVPVPDISDRYHWSILLNAEKQKPDAQLPMSSVWPLVAPVSNHSLTKCYLEYPVKNIKKRDSRSSLPIIAAASEQRLTLETIVKLGRGLFPDKIPEEVASQVQDPTPAESESRPIRLSDVADMIQKSEGDALNLSLTVASFLGISIRLRELDHDYGEISEKCIAVWRQILTRVPGLQTGHLQKLLMRHQIQEFNHLLPATITAEDKTFSLSEISPYAAQAEEFVLTIRNDPSLLSLLADYLDYTPQSTFGSLLLWLWGSTDIDAAFSFVENYKPPFKAFQAEIEQAGHEGKVPESLICPITLDFLKDPVSIDMSPHPGRQPAVVRHFSKQALLDWLKNNPRNPISRQPLDSLKIQGKPVDSHFANYVAKWREKHPEIKL